MGNFRLDRRSVIKGAGSIAIALPFLEIMGSGSAYGAASGPAKRYVTFYTPGGTVLDNWRCTGNETSLTLSPILKPLEAVKSKITVLDGLKYGVASGEVHQAGMVAMLTGTAQTDSKNNFAAGPSIDQILASSLSAGKKFQSLQMAVRWATGKTHGKIDPFNIINFENNDRFSPIPPQIDPVEIWQGIFGSLNAGGGNDPAEAQALLRQKSILDFVDKKYATLMKKLGKSDQAVLDQHLTKVRELEKSLSVTGTTSTICRVPTRVDTSDYNPRTGLNSGDDGQVRDVSTDAAIPKVGKFMMDMIVMALSCDLTGVATMQWTDTEAKHTFPWLDTIPALPLVNHLHFYEHDGGYRPAELTRIYTWYSTQFAYLVQAMSEVNLGDHTLLDETVMFWGTELQNPPTHNKENMPFVLAGNGGGLKSGRLMKYPGVNNNNLLVSLLNLCGDNRTKFGKDGFSTGPLAGLK